MKNNILKSSFLSIIFFGFILRYYNLGYDDLWYDEVISFWVANPDISLKNSFINNSLIEDNTYAYNFLLRNFFIFFGYSVENGRILSAIFSSFSILSVTYLSWQINKNYSFIFSAFLISSNIFLISYSQEMRVYSMLFFFCSLSLIFFLKFLKKKKFKDLFFFNITNLILLSLHPFSFIILFTYIIYLFFLSYDHKLIYFYISIAFNFFFFLFSNYLVWINSIDNKNIDFLWRTNPSIKFYTNFYFSAFFGSRLLGSIFLITLIYLLIINFKKILKSNYLILFNLIIFFSYSIPIFYGYIFKPVLVSRYIIFVIIPITLLISLLTFEIKNKKTKIFFISFLTLLSIGNHFTEQTFKQFLKTREVHKPEYTSALSFINKSDFKEYALLVENMKNNEATINAINNYINYLSKNNNFNIKYISQEETIKKSGTFWFICFQDINEKSCSINGNINQYKIVKEKFFNNINLKLLKFY